MESDYPGEQVKQLSQILRTSHLPLLAQDVLFVPTWTCCRDMVGLLAFLDDSCPQRASL